MSKQEIVEKNKALIAKYPFLLPRNVFTGEVIEGYDYTYTVWDDIDDGWRIAFGDLLLEELGEDAKKYGYEDTLRFDQIKEKYGQLRMYVSGYGGNALEIIDKYSILSENICVQCGQPDVYMTTCGWYYPCCKKCWDKNKNPKSYEEVIDNKHGKKSGMMPPYYTVYRFVDGEKVKEIRNVKETVDKIRERWSMLYGN